METWKSYQFIIYHHLQAKWNNLEVALVPVGRRLWRPGTGAVGRASRTVGHWTLQVGSKSARKYRYAAANDIFCLCMWIGISSKNHPPPPQRMVNIYSPFITFVFKLAPLAFFPILTWIFPFFLFLFHFTFFPSLFHIFSPKGNIGPYFYHPGGRVGCVFQYLPPCLLLLDPPDEGVASCPEKASSRTGNDSYDRFLTGVKIRGSQLDRNTTEDR